MVVRAPVASVTLDGVACTWDHLVDEYGPAIESFARSRGIRDAADVAQDVFVDALPRLGAFRGGRSDLRSFLFTIAYRRIADRHRRFYRRPERLTDFAAGASVAAADATASVEDEVVGRAESVDAMAALEVLDERSRQVLWLRIVDELDTDEIATALGLSPANVRAIQSRALKRVRKNLGVPCHSKAPRAMAWFVMPLLNRFRAPDTPFDNWVAALRSGLKRGARDAAQAASPTTSGSTVAAVASTTATTAAVPAAATGGTAMQFLTVAVLAAGTLTAGGVIATPAAEVEPAAHATHATQANIAPTMQHEPTDSAGAAVSADTAARISASASTQASVDAGASADTTGAVAQSTAVDMSIDAHAEPRIPDTGATDVPNMEAPELPIGTPAGIGTDDNATVATGVEVDAVAEQATTIDVPAAPVGTDMPEPPEAALPSAGTDALQADANATVDAVTQQATTVGPPTPPVNADIDGSSDATLHSSTATGIESDTLEADVGADHATDADAAFGTEVGSSGGSGTQATVAGDTAVAVDTRLAGGLAG